MGLLLQIFIGVVLLVFGLMRNDTAFQFASLYALVGILVWLGLIIIFHQHKLERLEALEDDELASTRSKAGSFFEKASHESRVAARRLALMHRWLMPAFSIVIALLLAGAAWRMLKYMDAVGNGNKNFYNTDDRGWAVAICLFIAAISFIFSRFIAGMAKQEAWQNLRGGAAYMVGNALVMVAVATGIIFRFFENESVIRAVAWILPGLLIVLVLEIFLNFILNLYRPRLPGDVPRPAFDSKLLSLLATPDSIVKSLNEAVNYQFGFDVTSSWGYQLLLRSFASLLILGFVSLILLSTMVVIEPHQQAVRLRGGRIIDNKVHTSGIMWKLPWPIETASVYDVMRVRSLHLTPKVTIDAPVNLWSESEPPRTDSEIEPFIVGSEPLPTDTPGGFMQPLVQIQSALGDAGQVSNDPEEMRQQQAAELVSNFYSLVDAEIILQYRIKDTDDGLLEYLQFAPEGVGRRQNLSDRERALKAIAVSKVSEHLSKLSLDVVLSPGRSELALRLQEAVTRAFDEHQTGVEVVAVNLPMVRPSGRTAPTFEELGIARQNREIQIAEAKNLVYKTFVIEIGYAELADQVIAAIDDYYRRESELGRDAAPTIEQRQVVEDLLARGGGRAAQAIAHAETDRWKDLMSKRAAYSRWLSELASYRAGPELYRQREIMKLYSLYLRTPHKFIIAIDPARVHVDFDLKDINPFQSYVPPSEEEASKSR